MMTDMSEGHVAVRFQDYEAKLRTEGRLEELRRYLDWLKAHERYLRRLWREQRGIIVPGDFDGGYK